MEDVKKCSFFGHRKIDKDNQLIERLEILIEDLIVNKNVKIFLFGSRSEFNSLCHKIVTKFKQKYTDIQRFSYICRNETCILESEKEIWQKIYSRMFNNKEEILCVEKEIEYKTKYNLSKACYVERN